MAFFSPISPGRSGRSAGDEDSETNENGFIHAQTPFSVGLNYLREISFQTDAPRSARGFDRAATRLHSYLAGILGLIAALLVTVGLNRLGDLLRRAGLYGLLASATSARRQSTLAATAMSGRACSSISAEVLFLI